MKKFFWFWSFLFLLSVGIFLAPLDTAHGFTLSPLRHTMVVDPGKTAAMQVVVSNNEDQTLVLIPEIDAFHIHPDLGHPQFGESDIAKSWIQTDISTITLRPGEERIVNFTVTVPAKSSPQSHYLGLFLKEKSGSGQIGIGKRLGTLLFLHVSGDVQEKLSLQDFSLLEKEGNRFFHIQAFNEGSIHLIPKGKISFFNLFGHKVGEVSVNPEERKVLPGGIWRVSIDVPKNLGKGKFRTELSLQYGQTQQSLNAKVSFWNIPWLFLWIAGVGIVGGMSFGIWKKFRKI